MPADRQKAVSPDHTELKVVLDQKTMAMLEEVRALLGPKGVEMSHDQLLQVMADATIAKLKEKRFGKRRAQKSQAALTTQMTQTTQTTQTAIRSR